MRQSQLVRFGAFAFDLRVCELYKGEHRIRMQEKPLRMLEMLIQQSGRLVTREELKKRLWPALPVEEVEDNLNSTVKKLREGLGDDAGRPLYIETVPRRGYRFIAPIQAEPTLVTSPTKEEGEGKDHTQSDGSRFEETEKKRSEGWLWDRGLIAAAALLTFAMILGLFSLIRSLQGAAADVSIHSLAVLPFENLSGDASQDYLAEGLTDALTTDLAELATVKVISRSSASHYKTNRPPLREIRKDLGVAAVVEGTFSRSGGVVRVNARLIATDDDRNLWAQSFLRDTGDILSLQDDLAQSVANRIQMTISPEMKARFKEARTVDVAAYEAYLNGMHDLNNHRTNNELRKGLEEFDQAIRLDPSLAGAYAGKSYTYGLLGDYDAMTGAEAGPKAIEAARQAVELDPALAGAHAALAFSLWKYEWNWKDAEAEFRRALELNPNNAHTQHAYGVFLACQGDFGNADLHLQKALALDPLSMIIRTNIGWMHYFQRDYAGAEAAYLNVLKVDPGFLPARQKLWITYAEEGRTEQAGSELENLMRLFGHERMLQIVEKAKPADRYRTAVQAYIDSGELSRYERARYLALLGKKREALGALGEAATQRSAWIVYLQIEPVFEGMRASREFTNLVKQANFPEAAEGR